MGCDIHLHIEIKVSGKWLHWNAPTMRRDYELFTKMAGVRARDDEIDPISQPRGLPADASDTTKWMAKQQGSDGHSHSYLTSTELTEVRKWGEAAGRKAHAGGDWWFDGMFGYVCGNPLDGMAEYPASYPPDLEDVRFVFWFDN